VGSGVASAALGAAAPGQAEGVMPPQVLGGPIWWYIVAVYVIAIALAFFVVADTLLPVRASRRAEVREPGWVYGAFQLVYLLCVLGAWLPVMPRPFAVVPVVLTPVSLVVGVAYLLRVVFPKPPKGDADPAVKESAESDENGTPQ
jgi:hypothetical protein